MRRSGAALLVLLGLSLTGVHPAVAQQESAAAAKASTAIVVNTDVTQSVPRLVQFNGTLKDAAARPVSGVASVTFTIYAEQDGGTALWSETQNVLADASGHFNVLLGTAITNGVPAELFGTGQSRWLGVTIARSTEMPRVLLASVPYALKAADADTLGGLPASAYVTTQSLAASSNPRAIVPLVGGSTTVIASPQVAGASPAAAAPPIANATAGIADYIPIWTSATAQGNSTIFETGGLVGIGTTTPAETLDVNGNSIFRGSFQLPPGHPAIASSGYESHSFQFQASSFNSTTSVSDTEAFGFRAEPLNNNTPTPSAKLDLFFGAGGSAPFTDTGFSFAANGIVTFAPGQSFNGASETITGNLNLPATNGFNTGVLTVGGVPFINDAGGITNAFIGGNAGGQFTSNSPNGNNTGVGYNALGVNTAGYFNTAVGGNSLLNNSSGTYNTAVGVLALQSNQTGIANTGIGENTGSANFTGSMNTFVGWDANTVVNPLTNATAIGANAVVGANNSLVLGSIAGVNGGDSNVNVGIGTSTPRSALELSAAGGNTSKPLPTLTLTNAIGATGGQVSIDFNTYEPSTTGTYNPAARILAIDDGKDSDYLIFYANTDGAENNGSKQTMSISPAGDVTIAGNLSVSGTVSKGGGSFKIDDPIDPGGKYLSHSFVESPDMMNIYNGSAILDAKGEATVTMPAWFDALNRDFQYQLTAVGGPGPGLYVAEEVHENLFKVAGGKPGLKVSWQITGVRHDAWAEAHRIPTEEEKPAAEQGHYMHPELFGAAAEKSIGSASMPTNKTAPQTANAE